MAESSTNVPVKSEPKSTTPAVVRPWQPFASLRREIDRLFEDFDGGMFRTPRRRALFDYTPLTRFEAEPPAVDIVERDKEFQITAELPGVDEKDIEVKLANGGLTIRGEKNEQKEEKKKNYYLSERHYGSFERYFALPDGVDSDKIAATYKKGVLTITVPKTAEAQKQEKKIAVKTE